MVGSELFPIVSLWLTRLIMVSDSESYRWCYENFVQFKTLSRARDVRDQLAGLCERVEIVPVANANSNDITPIQKSLVAGLFHCSVSNPKSRRHDLHTNPAQRRSCRRVETLIEQPKAIRQCIFIPLRVSSTVSPQYGRWFTMNLS